MELTVRLALQGQLDKFCAQVNTIHAQAVTGVVRKRVAGLKRAIRRQVVSVGLGKLQNAVRSETTPARGTSASTWGRVYSKAVVKRSGGKVDILTVFEEGAFIRPTGGRHFLAIPTPAAGRAKTPQQYHGELAFVPGRSGRNARLVDRDRRTIFVLIRTATVAGRLHMRTLARHYRAGIPQAIADDSEKRARKAGLV